LRHRRHLLGLFWKYWSADYVKALSSENRWRTADNKGNLAIKLQDVVLIKDDKLAKNVWQLGRVIELHSGVDGVVRGAKLQLPRKDGETAKFLNRSVRRLALLEGALV
jgi:hypothetical protein